MTRRLTRILPLALLTLVAALAGPGSASAIPPSCDDPSECTWTEDGDRTLTVTRTAGTITGTGINCGSDCSDNQPVIRSCEVGDGCADWPDATTWTLTASNGPAGYSAQWSACGRAPTCSVSLGSASKGDDSATVALSWVDTAKPSVTFAPPVKVGPSGYNVSAGGADNSGSIHHFAWWVDGQAQATTGSALSLSGVASGSHTVKVQSFDATGNGSDAVTKTVVVDKSVNVTPGTLPALTRAATAPLSFTTDADVVTRKCTVNNGTAVECASGWSGISAATPDGSYDYRVIVTDDVGNTKTSDARTVVVDRTLPAVAFTDGPTEGQQVVTRDVAITFSHADAHPGTVTCGIDATPVPCTAGSAVSLTGLGDGQHAFSVKAIDGAGNERTVTRTFAVKVTTPDPDPDPDSEPGNPRNPGNPGTGTGNPGTGTGTPGTGTGTGTGNPRPEAFDPFITGSYGYNAKKTWFTILRIKKLPATAKVVVTCKGKGCSLKSKKVAHKGGTVNLMKKLKKLERAARRHHPGARHQRLGPRQGRAVDGAQGQDSPGSTSAASAPAGSCPTAESRALVGRGGGARGQRRRRVALAVHREPVGEVHRDHRQQDHEHADDVDDRQLVRARQVGEDPDRQRLPASRR